MSACRFAPLAHDACLGIPSTGLRNIKNDWANLLLSPTLEISGGFNFNLAARLSDQVKCLPFIALFCGAELFRAGYANGFGYPSETMLSS